MIVRWRSRSQAAQGWAVSNFGHPPQHIRRRCTGIFTEASAQKRHTGSEAQHYGRKASQLDVIAEPSFPEDESSTAVLQSFARGRETLEVLCRMRPIIRAQVGSGGRAGRVRYSCLKEAARGAGFMQIEWYWGDEKGFGKR